MTKIWSQTQYATSFDINCFIRTNGKAIVHYHCRDELRNMLTDHLLEMLTIIRKWMTRKFSSEQLLTLHRRTVRFLSNFLTDYPGYAVMVLHVLLHNYSSVKKMGPLIETNMFHFERQDGFMGRNVNNYRSVIQNMANNMKRLSVLHLLSSELQFLNRREIDPLSSNLIVDTQGVSRFRQNVTFEGREVVITLSDLQYEELHIYFVQKDPLLLQYYNQYSNENGNHDTFSSFLHTQQQAQGIVLTDQQHQAAMIPYLPVLRHQYAYYHYYEYYSVLSERNINTTNNSWIYCSGLDKIGQCRMLLTVEHASQTLKLMYVDWFDTYNTTPGGMEFSSLADNIVPKNDISCSSFVEIPNIVPICVTPINNASFVGNFVVM